MKKNLLALILAVTMVLGLTACNGPAKKGTYSVGIVQLMQHVALDQATQGFPVALTE